MVFSLLYGGWLETIMVSVYAYCIIYYAANLSHYIQTFRREGLEIYSCCTVYLPINSSIYKFSKWSKLWILYLCLYSLFALLLRWIWHSQKDLNINKALAWIGSIAGLALNFGLTVLAFICKMDKLYEAINSYSSIIVVLQAICMYYLLTGINGEKENAFSKILISIDKVSLGIYLVHVGLLRVMIYGVKFNPYSYGFYMVIIATLIILILSYAISHILHKIPGVRKFI